MAKEAFKKVMVFGTFDIFHKGHENFLRQAGKYGEYLIVVVARDKTVLKIKERKPKNNEKQRTKILGNNGLADEVILGNIGNKYSVIKKYKPDVICLGYDQKNFIGKLEDKLKEFGLDKTRIIRLKSYCPEKYKSSLLK